jgi:hypothetical protein
MSSEYLKNKICNGCRIRNSNSGLACLIDDKISRNIKFDLEKFIKNCPCQNCPVVVICDSLCKKRKIYFLTFVKKEGIDQRKLG